MPFGMRMGMGLGSGGEAVGGFSPSKIAGLAVWIDAYTVPESIDSANGVKTIRCKKTNNQLVAPDIVAETSTLRPVYDAANKEIVFTKTNNQKLSKNGFFTTEPFKSATKGMGQAWTFVWVGSTGPIFTLGSYAGANGNFRGGGGAEQGGLLGINSITSKSIYAIIKPACTNVTWILDTFNTTSPYEYSLCSPIPIVYINGDKQVNGSTNIQATTNGDVFGSGNLSIGSWITLYYNMRMNEFLLYDNAISEADLLLLIAHLKAKWGIA
jgi:hypothetical protein